MRRKTGVKRAHAKGGRGFDLGSGVDKPLREAPEVQQTEIDAVGAENLEVDHEGPVADAVGGLGARAQLGLILGTLCAW